MIVKGFRALGKAADKVIDSEDRRVLATILAVLTVGVLVIVTTAGAAGLAVRLFEAFQ